MADWICFLSNDQSIVVSNWTGSLSRLVPDDYLKQNIGQMDENMQANNHPNILPNISTTQALMNTTVLEIVKEEDENSGYKEHFNENERGSHAYVEAPLTESHGSVPSNMPQENSDTMNTHLHVKTEHHRADSGHMITSKIARKIVKIKSGVSVGQTSDMQQHESNHNIEVESVDIANEKDCDTDLEIEEPVVVYDHTGKTLYLEACRKFGVVPTSYFIRRTSYNNLSMKHHGFTGDGMKAIAASLISNTTISTLNLSDNYLGYDGGQAMCEALKENCFITDLDLSDNHLNCCAEQLCQIIKLSGTLCRVNLSGNGFDDQSAMYLADLIMNTTKLEHLNLSHNGLGEKAGLLLGSSVSENLCLKELDLSWNHIRRKGAAAIAVGIKNNVYMKKINLAWNGLGLEGSVALMDALKTNNVLEELDITNNRITTEGAILIGKGLAVNETLKSLKIGKNPFQSAGCWGMAASILKNQNCILEFLDFTDIQVNKDFLELWKQVQEQFPNLKIKYGDYK